MPTPEQHSDQLTVALSAIEISDGFNPRSDAERAELDRLVESIRQHGLIHPLVVAPGDAEGRYRLVDGERRYRACAEAGVVEVPVIGHEPDRATEAVDVALVANIERVELTPVEEA